MTLALGEGFGKQGISSVYVYVQWASIRIPSLARYYKEKKVRKEN